MSILDWGWSFHIYFVKLCRLWYFFMLNLFFGGTKKKNELKIQDGGILDAILDFLPLWIVLTHFSGWYHPKFDSAWKNTPMHEVLQNTYQNSTPNWIMNIIPCLISIFVVFFSQDKYFYVLKSASMCNIWYEMGKKTH